MSRLLVSVLVCVRSRSLWRFPIVRSSSCRAGGGRARERTERGPSKRIPPRPTPPCRRPSRPRVLPVSVGSSVIGLWRVHARSRRDS